MTSHGVWIANWIYWTLINRNYNLLSHTVVSLRTLQLATLRISVSCAFTSRCLVTVPNAVDSSGFVFTSLPATYCLISSLSPPLLAIDSYLRLTTTDYHSLLQTSTHFDPELICLKIPVESPYVTSAQTQQRTPPPTVPLLCMYLAAVT
jgi:hypothetical protein